MFQVQALMGQSKGPWVTGLFRPDFLCEPGRIWWLEWDVTKIQDLAREPTERIPWGETSAFHTV